MKRNPCHWIRALIACAAFGWAIPVIGEPQSQPSKIENLEISTGSARRFVAALELRANRSANDLGWECMAAAALVPAYGEAARRKLAVVADRLLADIQRSSAGQPLGWTASIRDPRCPEGGYDAFGDGSCNPAHATYAFQTGLSIACLGAAFRMTHEERFLSTAEAVFAHWRQFVLPEKLCEDCVYFATSDQANDAGRYIRNMNVFMAFGAAELGRATGKKEYLDIAERALRSDVAERAAGNRGYFGRNDPDWAKRPREAERIENHTAAMAVLSLAMAKSLGPLAADHGRDIWRDWATCNNEACRNNPCRYWAGNAELCQATTTAAHCAFRNDEPRAMDQCRIYLGKLPSIPAFAIWAINLRDF